MIDYHEIRKPACVDNDGNIILKGMSVISGGDEWVVGYSSPKLVRLDRRKPHGIIESRLMGRQRLSCVHIIGLSSPLVFKDGNNPYEG